jgi:predicted outer membrane repeat protein
MVLNNTFTGNTAQRGGAVYLDSSFGYPYPTVTMDGNLFTGNSVTHFSGGAITVDASAKVYSLENKSWPRVNTPPNEEPTNTYEGNSVGGETGVEGCDVYFI